MIVRLKLIRWTLLLCAGLFCSMVVLGQDRGQQRLGLTSARATQPSRNVVAPLVIQAAKPLAQTNVSLSFAPVAPLIAMADASPVAEQAASASVAVADLMYVRTDRANLRAGPGKEFNVRAKLARGQTVEIVQGGPQQGAWVLVRTDGARGYIAASLLTNLAP